MDFSAGFELEDLLNSPLINLIYYWLIQYGWTMTIALHTLRSTFVSVQSFLDVIKSTRTEHWYIVYTIHKHIHTVIYMMMWTWLRSCCMYLYYFTCRYMSFGRFGHKTISLLNKILANTMIRVSVCVCVWVLCWLFVVLHVSYVVTHAFRRT